MFPDVIDYSTARPDPARIKANGYQGGVRYLSDYSAKNLTRAEFEALDAQGLGVAVVWENGAKDALRGASGGMVDCVKANVQADALGLPRDMPIYYAVDTDVTGNLGTVAAYFAGLETRPDLRKPLLYGQYSVIEQAGDGWQTMAWSAGRVSAHARMVQVVGGVTIPDTDVNHVHVADWGQHNYNRATMPKEGSDMLVVKTPANGAFLYWPDLNGIARRPIDGGFADRLIAGGFPSANLGAADATALSQVTAIAPVDVVDEAALAKALAPYLVPGADAASIAKSVLGQLKTALPSA